MDTDATFVLVAGDFWMTGGMDRANFELARHLASEVGAHVHVVTHRAADELRALPSIVVHPVPRPLGWHVLGRPLLARHGRLVARRLAAGGARVIVNGGNCLWNDVSWVHYVHAAFDPAAGREGTYGLKRRLARHRALRAERATLERAGFVICNSRSTQRDVTTHYRVPEARTRVVYYGIDPREFGPISGAERRTAREDMGLHPERPLAAFVGALGDRRKGFDILYEAWRRLCLDHSWDCDLLVVGTGAELAAWKRRTRDAGLECRIRFLGFRDDVVSILAASDVLVHPARYEAYGLSVHEALCRGVPALVSAGAGVAERYPASLVHLLLEEPVTSEALVERLRAWRVEIDECQRRVVVFAAELRRRTWTDMGRDIHASVSGHDHPTARPGPRQAGPTRQEPAL